MNQSNEMVLWNPAQKQIESTHMTQFSNEFASSVGTTDCSYAAIHRLSLEQPGKFWQNVWHYCKIPGTPGQIDFMPGEHMIDARWFPNGRLNFAEACTHPDAMQEDAFADSIAIHAFDEQMNEYTLSRRELLHQVSAFAGFLNSRGVKSGDRVAAVLPNTAESVVAMIATAAIGGIWSSCSPEFGEDAIVDRFGQINPKVLITSKRTTYNHKPIEPLQKVSSILQRLPSVETIIVIGEEKQSALDQCNITPWRDAIAATPLSKWDENPFSHPLCIVYSSGTTGAPKCMVHGVGGTVLQHAKEHQLHCDLKQGDVLFYYTTTGWMMWNWLLSGLISKATIVLYDGSPMANGASTLFQIAETAGVTHFGAGARYYASLEKHDYRPKEQFALSKLRCLMSTGSPLLPSNFDWLYKVLGETFSLASISGGTDILSCFVLGNPNLPVRSGKIQCKGLGMDVQIWDSNGKRVFQEPGELVCTKPFPSMPICFWNDPDNIKYLNAYFSRFPNVWCHGDWAEENNLGEFVIYGRSDATLNPGGVRIGTAEIYQQLESFPEIAESIATVLRKEGDEQIVLFLRLATGYAGDGDLAQRIRSRLKSRCSPRHVPAYVDYVPDLPRTISGKLSEIAVRSAISGGSLGNAGALANPESLRFFEAWKPSQAY